MKYIDAEKLKERISRLRDEFIKKSETKGYTTLEYLHKAEGLSLALQHIASLQQWQTEIQNGKFVFPKYLYARTKDNKTIDMSYVPQDMTAVEYIRNDFVEQEQQEVDFEDVEFLLAQVKYMSGLWVKTNPNCTKIINAFNSRLNARKEK